MQRRTFLGALAGVGLVRRRSTVLHAIAAPRLPTTIRVPAALAPGAIVEVRQYRTQHASDIAAVLKPLLFEVEDGILTCWTVFPDLVQREKAWREFNYSAEWIRVRDQATLQQLSIWRAS